jgi:hypothetical protein
MKKVMVKVSAEIYDDESHESLKLLGSGGQSLMFPVELSNAINGHLIMMDAIGKAFNNAVDQGNIVPDNLTIDRPKESD